ncbi:12319_t:CDS:2 [Ambispora gerdemannii]|uniref:12319_t:CDS:1 n=1 Tax=Ambispora gerdemannii TaxID=144530 RepID=A0A9N9DHT7_9GLOM|nr:12319_t:CDS:2 [Ambispora gerdemannii]
MLQHIHEYFNRKSAEWTIIGFLNECEEETFRKKIDSYLKSLQNLVDLEPEGNRKEMAHKLLDAYKKASKEFFVENARAQGTLLAHLCSSLFADLALVLLGHRDSSRSPKPYPDYYVARKLEEERKSVSGPSVHFHQITNSSVIGVNNGPFTVNRSKRNHEEDDFEEKIEQITKKERQTKNGRKIPDYRELTSDSSEGDDNAGSDYEQTSIEEEKTSAIRSTKRIKSNEQSVNEDEFQIPSGYSTPSPQPSKRSVLENNIFFEEDDGIVIIDDVDLCFRDGNPADDYKIGETNVSQLFRRYQNKSIKIAKAGGLFVESNAHEILSLSSIFMLTPNSHSKTMIDIFGSTLLDEVYRQVNPAQQIGFDSECENVLRKVIKKAIKESRGDATKLLLSELANSQTLDENLGSVILECLKTLPITKIKNEPSETTLITNYLDRIMKGIVHDPDKYIVEWPNTGLDESKARKPQGRSKQPDFVVSIIHQLQTSGVIFVGEVSPPSEKNNVYKNCNDLIRLGIFMKDCLDSAIDLGADINILGFQCVDHTIDFYMMDLIQGTYIMIHIGQVTVPASVKELLSFVDEIEVLLVIREIFRKSFDTFYAKICNPSPPSTKAMFKRDTLSTPKFKQLVSKTRDCYRSCPFWFGRF